MQSPSSQKHNSIHDIEAVPSHVGQVLSFSKEDNESANAALERYVPGTAEEKRLVRKIDLILLPVLWWMYVLAYVDRGNVVCIFSLLTKSVAHT